jgi:DnaD/phage-associated family protein
MESFTGFPPGETRIKFPAAFFSDLLPLIDDLAELKLLLFCFWALLQKDGQFRYLRRQDFASHADFMRGLVAHQPEIEPEMALDAALAKATQHGSLLCAEMALDNGLERLYFVNTVRGRTAIEQIKAGEWQPGDANNPVEILPERPNIYRLYEANIGPLTPRIRDRLVDAAADYPTAWIEEAIYLAVENNKRAWSYIQAILTRWEKEGKINGAAQQRSGQAGPQYIAGPFADFIEH